MLPSLLRDYQALVQAGQRPYLTMGPWTHFDPRVSLLGMREAVAWFRTHLLSDKSRLRTSPVRLFVGGAGDWRELAAFPPATMHQQRWYLQPGGGLANMVPPMSEPDQYRYDPAQPTPSVGGAARSFATGPGSQDNRALEARPDVLTYTNAPFERDIEVIGPVSADLFVRSSLSHTDFFMRVTDVEPRAASMNVCDGLQRLFPSQPAQEGDGGLKVHIELFPTAYRFRRGHRLRVQVSSGAFPRFARNLGSGEPLSTATTLCMADQSVYHDPAHPSAIILPIVDEHQEVGTLLDYLVGSYAFLLIRGFQRS
jgi:putative CocE/NonD family hydrolase